MPRSAATPGPVTADDLDLAVHLAVDTLRGAPADAQAWEARAGVLEWTCWETVEHLADDLFFYAVQLGPRTPPTDGEVPFAGERRRPGGPFDSVHADRAAGTAGLLQVLEACGALLSAMTRVTPPHVRAHHVFGASDPEGFAAMGVVETLVHTHDLAAGLGIGWDPPAGVCARVLARLFPDAPADAAPWPALLWSTGRADLPSRPRPATWRWYGAPRDGRGQEPSAPARRVVPNVRTEALAESRDFYARLGLEQVMDMGWIRTFASRSNPTAQISVMTHDMTGPVVPDLSVEVDDVDAVHAAVRASGAQIVHPLQDEEWGVRRFFVRDPAGRVVNVLTHRRS